jgi:hypothetical protein
MLENNYGGVMASLAEKLNIAPNVLASFLKGKNPASDKKVYSTLSSKNYNEAVEILSNGNFILTNYSIALFEKSLSKLKDVLFDVTFLSSYTSESSARLQLLDIFINGGNFNKFKQEHVVIDWVKIQEEGSDITSLVDDRGKLMGIKELFADDDFIKCDPFTKHSKLTNYSNALNEINSKHDSYIYGIQIPNYLLSAKEESKIILVYSVDVQLAKIKKAMESNSPLDDQQINFCNSFNYNASADFFKVTTLLNPAKIGEKTGEQEQGD